MGWRESLLGSGFQYKPSPEPPATPVQATYPATRIIGGGAAVGGQVKVSSDAVVFEPVDTDAARRVLVNAGRLGLMPGAGIANRALDETKLLEPMTISTARITSVKREQPTGLVPRLFAPPSVRLGLGPRRRRHRKPDLRAPDHNRPGASLGLLLPLSPVS